VTHEKIIKPEAIEVLRKTWEEKIPFVKILAPAKDSDLHPPAGWKRRELPNGKIVFYKGCVTVTVTT